MACKIFKVILSAYTVWLIGLKIYYRSVLGDLKASLARDFV